MMPAPAWSKSVKRDWSTKLRPNRNGHAPNGRGEPDWKRRLNCGG